MYKEVAIMHRSKKSIPASGYISHFIFACDHNNYFSFIVRPPTFFFFEIVLAILGFVYVPHNIRITLQIPQKLRF